MAKSSAEPQAPENISLHFKNAEFLSDVFWGCMTRLAEGWHEADNLSEFKAWQDGVKYGKWSSYGWGKALKWTSDCQTTPMPAFRNYTGHIWRKK